MNTEKITYDRDTKLLGLLGYPLGHSITPAVHNHLYRFTGINAVMLPMELENTPGMLDRFIDAVKTLRIRGFIVTMPYKTQLLPYLDEVPEECRVFNCVNAVRYIDGKFYGAAFDGYGMCQAIEDSGVRLEGREVLMIGAGRISGVVAGEMARRGVTAFTILNRTPERAEHLAHVLRTYTGKPAHAGPLTKAELEQAAGRAGVVAQCTAAGMYGTGTTFPHVEFMRHLDQDTIVAEALYNPPQTAFLEAAAQRGLHTVNGLGMLSNQVTRLIEFFFGVSLGMEEKAEAVRAIRQAMERT